jgi:hypothetical protein
MQKKSVKGFATAFSRFSSLLLAILFAGSVSKAQQIFISEDFSTGTGTTPPSGWTQNKISGAAVGDLWNFSNPKPRAFASPIAGNFAIFDSDFMGTGANENVALESPSVNTTGKPTVWLQWDQYFNGTVNANDSIAVEVFNGSTWNTVYSYKSSAPITSSNNIDVSAFAGNKASTKVRFRFVGNYSYWWIVDNVVLYNGAPVSNFSVNNDNQCIPVNSFVFTNLTTNTFGTMSYSWDFGDGSPLSTAVNPPPKTYAVAGTYLVKLKATTSYNGVSNTSQSNVYVIAAPTATFTVAPGANTCASTNTTYTTQTGQTNYLWSVPGTAGVDYNIISGSIGTSSNTVTLQWLTAGSKTVTVSYKTLSVSTCQGFSASNTTTVNLRPTPSFTATPGAPVCTGFDQVYTTQSGQQNYAWGIPGVLNTDYTITSGGTSADNTVTLKWLTAGSKTVTIGYTSPAPAGCPNLVNGSNTVTANASPVVTFSPAVPSVTCQNVDVLYRTQSNVTNNNFIWTVPGTLGVDYSVSSGSTGTSSNQVTLKWLTGGNKTVTVNYTSNATGCTSPANGSATTLVDIPTPTFTTAPGANVCDKTDITYTTQSGQTNYVWSVPGIVLVDYTITSGGTGPTSNTVTLKWLTTGSKTVTVGYTNSNGCTYIVPASNTTTVNASPTITYTAQPGATICSSTDVTYTTQAGQSSYVWSVPGVLATDYTITSGGIGSTSNTVTLKWLTSGSKTVTVNYNNAAGCPGLTVASNTTTVNLRPSATFTTSPGTSVCSSVDVTYTTQSGQTNYAWSVPGTLGVDYTITSGGTGITSNTVTLKWLTAGSKTVTVNYTDANGCTSLSAASNTTTVNLTPVITFTASPGANTCSQTDVTYTTQSGQTNYVWSVPGTLGVDYTITSGGIGTTSNTVTLQWLTAGSKTVTVNYTTTSGCPGLAVASNTTTVNLRPVPSFTAGASAISCTGVDVTYTTQAGQANYAWTVPGTLGVDYTITSGGIGSTSNTVTLKWLTTGSKTVTVNYTNASSCTGFTAVSNTTTVNTTPAVNAVSNQTVCATNSTAAVNFSSVPAGATFTWSNNNTAIGLAASGSGNIPSFVATNSTTSNITGTINITALLNGCTSPAGANFTITVINYISAQPANTTVCYNGSASFTVGTVGVVTYQWYENRVGVWWPITNGTNNGATYSGATTATLGISGFTSMFSGFQYRCVVTGTCSVTSSAATLTVNTQPAITAQPANVANQCPGGVVSYTVAATGAGLTYQWQENTGVSWNNITNGGIYQNATTPTLTLNGVASAMNGYQYRSVVSGTCTPSPVTSNLVTLNVGTAPVLTASPVSVAKCLGSSHTFVAGATGTGLVAQWQLSTDNGTTWNNVTNGGVYSGATTSNLTITGMTATMNGYQYRCVFTGYCPSPVTTSAATLTVNSPAAIVSNPVNSTVCEGGTTAFSITASGTPTLIYQWQVNFGSGFVNVNPNLPYFASSNSTTPTLTVSNIPALLNGTQFRCVVYSNTCLGPVNSGTATLTVNTLPAITVQPTNKVTCTGSNTVFTITGTGTGISYQWQENNGSGFTNITGGLYTGFNTNSLTLNGTPLTYNNYQYRCIISGTCTPSVTSNAVSLTVNSLPAITAQPISVNLCPGVNTFFQIAATGTGITYQWQVNQGAGFVNLTNTPPYNGVTTNRLDITGVVYGLNAYQYRCVVSGTCAPPAISNSALMTVKNPVIILSQTRKDSACEGEIVTMGVVTYGSALQYQWQVLRPGAPAFVDLINFPPYSGTTIDVMNIAQIADTMNGFKFRCKVFETVLCNTVVYSDTIPMIVNLVPPATGSPSAINEGQQATFTISGTSATTKFQWQEDKNNGTGFNNLADGVDYNGVNTNVLTITSVKASQNNYRYRAALDSFCATTVATKAAVLKVLPTGIGKTSYADNTVIVYPNPVSGNELFIKITKQSVDKVTVRVVDVVGKLVYNKEVMISNSQGSIDVSGLVPGTYNMIITDNVNQKSSAVQFTRLQ